MTRTKRTVVLWALAAGMLATSTSPALADRHQTVAPADRHQTVTALPTAQSPPISATVSVRSL